MPLQVTVAYPWDAKFDMDYYLATHMPLVDKHWKSAGLQKWDIIKSSGAPDGSATPDGVVALLHWPDRETFDKAVGSEGAGEIMGDIPNFSDKSPVLSVCEVVKST